MADHYLTQRQIELAVGGAAELRQLFKMPGSTAIDPEKVEHVQNKTDGDIRGAIALSWDIDSFDALWFGHPVNGTPVPAIPWGDMDKKSVFTAAEKIVVKYAWIVGTSNQTCPQIAFEEAKEGAVALTAIGGRLRDLGTKNKPNTDRNYKFIHSRNIGNPTPGGARSRFRGYT